MTWIGRGLFLIGGLTCAACSLRTYPPTEISLTIEAPRRVEGRGRAPDLSSVTCFAVFATGTGRSVTSANVSTRSPSCLQMEGEFLGAFSYSSLTGKANSLGQIDSPAKVSLPPGVYSFSLLALHNAPSCGNDLNANYQNGTATETYPVVGLTTVDTRTGNTKATLRSTYDAGTAVNRTVICPVDSVFSCAGATLCDTFSEENVFLADHAMDSSHLWTTGNGSNPMLRDGKVELDTGLGVQNSAHSGLLGDPFVEILFKMSEGLASNVGVTLRHSPLGSYVVGWMAKNDTAGNCSLAIADYNGGFTNVLATTVLSYPNECPAGSYNVLRLTEVGNFIQLTYLGRQVSVSYVGSLIGNNVGMSWQVGAGVTTLPLAEGFRAGTMARFSTASLTNQLRGLR